MAFDLNSILEDNEDGEPFEFTWDGETYSLPPVRDMRAVGAMASGRIEEALMILFGDEQWVRFQASPSMFGRKRMRALMDAYGKHIDGLTSGESLASSGSSRSTAGRSKQTSGSAASRSRK